MHSPAAIDASRRKQGSFLFLAFFLSGISGLIYQTVWVRMLTRYLGSTTASTATVLSVFMGGLAIGAYVGGKWADRTARHIVGYALLEVGIAAGGILSSWIIISALGSNYAQWFGTVAHSPAGILAFRVLFCMLCLFPPTVLMGATLPLLVAHRTSRYGGFQHGLGRLYAINTFGAVTGVVATGFVLLGVAGETGTLKIAVGFNLIAALLAIYLQFGRDDKPLPKAAVHAVGVEGYAARIRYLARITIFISGFSALAYEILWTRLLMLPLETSIYAFSAMLGFFLLGIGAGSWMSTRFRISQTRPVAVFASLEVMIGFLTLLGMFFYARMAVVTHGFTSHFPLCAITAVLMIFPVATCFGWQFPAAVRCCLPRKPKSGKDTGWAYAVNTMGAIAGSLIVGFFAIPWMGTARSMVTIGCINVLLGVILLGVSPKTERGWIPGFVAVLVAGFVLLIPLSARPYRQAMESRLHRLIGPEGRALDYVEGIAGTLVPAAGHPSRHWAKGLFINGKNMTSLLSEAKLMAHLPLIHVDSPKTMAIICFGMGTTLRSAVRHPAPNLKIDAVDIIPEVFPSMSYFHQDAETILTDPSVTFHANDGRNFLLVSKTRYDVITIDPAPPIHSAGTVNLYSREFLALCRNRITEAGVVCLWLPPAPKSELMMIMKAFVNVFPGASLWRGLGYPGFYLLGGHRSMAPTPEKLAELESKLRSIEDMHEWENTYRAPGVLGQMYLMGPSSLAAFVRDSPEVTDDRPFTEFPLWRVLIKEKVKGLSGWNFRHAAPE